MLLVRNLCGLVTDTAQNESGKRRVIEKRGPPSL